ncbi:MAG: 4-hydroxy-3-methylbut-2-en-1-yl diphosphate synthase [Chloroflexi bacterium]|nr:4-hydroxy-3-methylbut-2-en-1-yl diphosphate synthase [Chloroflexota bacterium]|tara:strand:+ start:389 stop:1585 length:1197 start_codon:yes stop_codon:yes gene_type:complete
MKTDTHVVNVGGIEIGGSNPIVIQSMTDTDTSDIISTVSQIEELYQAGSQIVRVTVNNSAAAKAIEEIKTRLSDKDIFVPIVGDFHFIGHKILRNVPKCAELLDKYRINPGNLGKGNKKDANFKTFIDIAKDLDKPVRIGVNAGSLDQELLDIKMDEYSGNKTSQQIESHALVSSALISYDKALDYGLKENKIIVSCKVSRLNQMIECYREISKSIQAPLHLGLTEAGLGIKSIVSTTAALSILLHEGIGDTIRSSLTPELNSKRSAEVELCKEILQSLSIRNFKAEVTACPGCGRTTSNYFRQLTGEIKHYLDKKNKEWIKNYPGSENLKVAVMGCVVNGPGESKAANIGISLPGSGENPVAPVYIDGEKIKLLSGSNIAGDFIRLVDEYVLNKWGK